MVQNKKQEKGKLKKRRVIFAVEAPKAKKVCLVGDFNDWDGGRHPMKRSQSGKWEKIAVLAPGRYEYRFLVDGEWWNDPENDDRCFNCFGSQNDVIHVKRKK
jgi:1,4-alpha-glucan branching enzyme